MGCGGFPCRCACMGRFCRLVWATVTLLAAVSAMTIPRFLMRGRWCGAVVRSATSVIRGGCPFDPPAICAARLSGGLIAGVVMFDMAVPLCGVCGFTRASAETFEIGGNALHLCWHCRQIEAAMRVSGVLALVPQCRVLIACEFEHEAESCVEFSAPNFRGWLQRLGRRLNTGGLRGECCCQSCRSVIAANGSILALRATFAEVAVREVPFAVLRSMRPGEVVIGRDGTAGRADDEIKLQMLSNSRETLRGPVGLLALSAMVASPPAVSEAQKAADIQRACLFWRAVSLFGGGGYFCQDGGYVDAVGEVHRVPPDV